MACCSDGVFTYSPGWRGRQGKYLDVFFSLIFSGCGQGAAESGYFLFSGRGGGERKRVWGVLFRRCFLLFSWLGAWWSVLDIVWAWCGVGETLSRFSSFLGGKTILAPSAETRSVTSPGPTTPKNRPNSKPQICSAWQRSSPIPHPPSQENKNYTVDITSPKSALPGGKQPLKC